MSHEPTFAPERLVAALNGAGTRYVVVGGLAVGTHGVVRATRDLDIVCAPAAKNMDRVADCLTSLGGSHPVEERLTGESLARPMSFKVPTRHGDCRCSTVCRACPPSTSSTRIGSSSGSLPTQSPRSARSLTCER